MIATQTARPPGWEDVPEPLRRAAEGWLKAQEPVLSFLLTDLDPHQRYGACLLVLTGQGLLALDGAGVQAWPREEVAGLTCEDRGGVGLLGVLGHARRLATFSYTIAQARRAAAFVRDFEARGGPSAEAPVEGAEAAEAPETPEAVAHEQAPRVGTLLRLLRFARPHAAHLLLGVMLTLATTAAGLVPPYLTMPLVDEVLAPYQDSVRAVRDAPELPAAVKAERLQALKAQSEGPFRRVPTVLVGMLLAAVAAWLLGWAQGWVLSRLSERISADLRNGTFAHLQKLSIDFFSTKRTGDLVSRVSSDTDRICNFLSDTLTDFITDVLMIAGAAVMMFSMDPVLALATLCTFPLVAWLTLRTRGRLTHGFLAGYRAWAQMTNILADTIPGIRVVKAFAAERREVERFRAANARIVQLNDRVNRLWTFFWPMVALLNQLGLLVAWAFGAWRVYEQRITVGVLTAFLAYIARFYTRLEAMTRMASSTQKAAASAQRIFDILDRAPSVPEPARPREPGRVQGEVELRGVGLRFGTRRVLSELSLKIRPGEMVGVVGATGAGKSTLVNLVCRFYDPHEGAVLVDGTDIRAFPLEAYRKNIGIVLQDPFLFYGTIAENIAYGRPEATREQIMQAARAARAHDFILQLPDGYDSIVGERGQTLSGGERQRISIARALLIDPRILILDEATSAIDPRTEREIQAALDNLVRGRTTIAIAHRLSTLRAADRIVVLDRGQLVEQGPHEELLRLGGTYRRLYEAQLRREQQEEVELAAAARVPSLEGAA
ncbi:MULTISPECIES: ABC transporter ATP-binding protein [Myxococcaceae]|uniref:cyanophycin metabolism-associated ABC transporter n=1 Tax=Myxococcaceae TaxID=31 RepID=UPI001E610117|nr:MULTISPECIES: ABC transporter ATP-binding protein [Myxococcaceae]